jgi:hypothetical protein
MDYQDLLAYSEDGVVDLDEQIALQFHHLKFDAGLNRGIES